MRRAALIAALVALMLLALTACSEPQPSTEPPTLSIYISQPGDDAHLWKIGIDAQFEVWITNPELIPDGPGPHKVDGVFGNTLHRSGEAKYVIFTISQPSSD
ncbi:MAG: hypothetical protein P9M14_07535 [Candidatus Alcyoniella australis]|nr:hypothetical protein [Candidatus Alcyoniella australis]